jgi:serine protease AprX
MDRVLQQRAKLPSGTSRIIIQSSRRGSAQALTETVRRVGGRFGRRLPARGEQVAMVPNGMLALLAANPMVERLSLDRRVAGANERTGATVGATAVRETLGYDGSGVGIAIVDSGVTPWHDDLAGPSGGQRVEQFVDFVNGRDVPYDDYGHGTHVAGIIAGNGFDSDGARSGIAPAAHLIVLKVLNGSGTGYISDVIAAIDYAVSQRDALNIRVINLSVAAGVYESYDSDPLTLAAQRAVNAGIVVVAAAGNHGRSAALTTQYGGITAPGNAPWVLTVGASSHMGTTERSDDTVAPFSSRGPGAVDAGAKPDIVAPGVGTESLSDPDSSLYSTSSPYLLGGTVPTTYLPYLSLSGTSMSAPVVTGTVALMLQANPSLSPNAVKAILEYTAEAHADNDPLTQGAGYLNAKGAVELARFMGKPGGRPYPDTTGWSRRVIWGNRLATGGRLTAEGTAWATDVLWGSPTDSSGQSVTWGVVCVTAECEADAPWSDLPSFTNVVWGSLCGGLDCEIPWTVSAVTAANDGETVVWGTGDGTETVVWGTDVGETVVWGTRCSDPSCTPVIWKKR